MGKLNTLPDGVKKAQVVLTTYDEETDTTKLVTRDGKHWFSKYGSAWAEMEPEPEPELNMGHAPKYDPAQEEYDDPEEGEGEANENVAEGREEDEDDEPEPKSEAELKAEAAQNKAANKRTVLAQKKAASEGDPNAGKQNNLLNRQARLAGEKVTDQHVVDSGPGGSGAARTLTEREIEILEDSEEGAAARKAERQEAIANAPTIDNELPPEVVEELSTLRAEVSKLKGKIVQKDAMIAKMQVYMRGKFEGVDVDPDAPAHLAPSPMAGVYPHNTDEVPTVDEVNARNGQPESAPRTLSNIKRRDERGFPIASEADEAKAKEAKARDVAASVRPSGR